MTMSGWFCWSGGITKAAPPSWRMLVPRHLGGLALGAILAVAGCSSADLEDEELGEARREARADNGLGSNGSAWNGLTWNGSAWNGIGWNGSAWNGIGWNGSAWNGIGWNGSAWNGSAWNGSAWNGSAWNGSAWNGVAGQDSPIFTTLHNWINHSDANGNGTPSASRINKCGPTIKGTTNQSYSSFYLNDDDEMMARVQALAYWTSCACPSNVEIPFSDTHGRYSTTLYGGLGLAPIWCGASQATEVPEDELELVSACLIARVNVTGRHFPLSLRSLESGTAYTANEYISHRHAVAWYWGNLWKQPHVDNDTTTLPYNAGSSNANCALGQTPAQTSCNNLGAAGGTWWNQERFGIFGGADQADYGNQPVYGRVCDAGSSACANQISYVGTVNETTRKRLGESGNWDPAAPTTSYYKGVAPLAGNTNVAGGFSYLYLPTATGGGSKVKEVYYRGRSWRVLQVYFPYIVGFEDPASTAPPFDPELLMWSQIEAGGPLTVSSGADNQVVLCPQGQCQGRQQNAALQWEGRKLVNLKSTQAITVNLTGNLGDFYPTGDPNEPMSAAIRYSRAGLLGAGQCHPISGCAGTVASDCDSGVVGADGSCVGGTASPGRLRIWVKSNRVQAPATEWVEVHGGSTVYSKNLFPPTITDANYTTAYIYPLYMQDSASTIPGRTDRTSAVTYDTLRMKVQGESGVPVTDAPQLDSAYFFPGAPPSDADCKGNQGCWLFAGPRVGLSLAQNTQYTYQSPQLPKGRYTFTLTNVVNDADLYVRINEAPTTALYTCASTSHAGNANESCSVDLPERGGRIHVMVRGYSATQASAFLIGTN